jgi:AcrR family transcriptional regulator
MPVFVDHDRRRQEVAEIAYDLIAKGGTDAATIRNVADAAGYSTTIVSHYFASKRELLQVTYDLSVERGSSLLMKTALQGDLQKTLEIFLPTTPNQKKNWRVWLAFRVASLADKEIAKQQRVMGYRARGWMKDLIKQSSTAARKLSEPELHELARRMLSQLIGIAVQASFDPLDWPIGDQQKAVADLIKRQIR